MCYKGARYALIVSGLAFLGRGGCFKLHGLGGYHFLPTCVGLLLLVISDDDS